MSTVFPELKAIEQDLIAIRHDIHMHPELSMQEERTAALIADQLRKWGIEDVTTGVGKYGIVAVIHGAEPGPMIGIRADFDALPLQEKTGLPWASQNPGKMHACGHDGHATTLLGVAYYLHQVRQSFKGSVACIFQPAEEGVGGAPSGAVEMLKDGLFSRWPIDEVYACHQFVPLKLGQVGLRPGYCLAAADFFTITVNGKGGHGAYPQMSIDPVMIGSQFITALQSIVSRNLAANDQGVITVGGLSGGSLNAGNVIPDSVSLSGTVRTFDPKVRERIIARMNKLCEGFSTAFDCKIDLNYRGVTAATYNHPEQSAAVVEIMKELYGEDCVFDDIPQWMGGEDFSYMLAERPGCFIRIGNSDETHTSSGHNPHFDFNDGILVTAGTLLSTIALRRLEALAK